MEGISLIFCLSRQTCFFAGLFSRFFLSKWKFNAYLPRSFFIHLVPAAAIFTKSFLLFSKEVIPRPFTFLKICAIMENAEL